MLASQGYNYEVSFAPVLLMLLYLFIRKERLRSFAFVAFIIGIAILLVSFRETLLLGLVSLVVLCIIPWNKVGKDARTRFLTSSMYANATFLVLVCTRVFLLASYEYFKGYVSRLVRLLDSIVTVLKGSWEIKEEPLHTLTRIQNPLDANLAFISVVSAVSILVLVAILSVYLVSKRNGNSYSLGLFITYLLAVFIPISGYIVDKITGSGPLIDFSSVTVLPRTLLPLTVLSITRYSEKIRVDHLPFRKLFLNMVILYLAFTLIFAPFIFLREETKSSYDMLRTFGDRSEYTILGNSMYKFVIHHLTATSEITILDPSTNFLHQYYLLPLSYGTNRQIGQGAVNIPLESKVFDNGIFTISTYDGSTLFLSEFAKYGSD